MIDLLKQNNPPNGHFVEDLIVYGSLESGSVVAKGFAVEPPCLRSGSVDSKNDYHDRLRQVLQTLNANESLQIQWSCNSDYKKALTNYYEDTKKCRWEHIRGIRNKKFVYFWEKMERRELRREELVFFLTKRIDSYSGNFKTRKGLEKYYRRTLDSLHTHFAEKVQQIRIALGNETVLRGFSDIDNFTYAKQFLNPSLLERSKYVAKIEFSPELSLQENILNSDGVPVGKGFYMDGNYHNIFTLSRWPSKTAFGIIYHLTGLPFLDYRITLNISPIPIEREVQKEERALERLQGEYESQNARRSHATAIHKKESKIDSLSSGYIYPFKAEFIIRAWDPTESGLQAKCSAIKQAINSMSGAQYIECALPTTAKKLFFNTWPGNNGSYTARKLYAEDTYLADMIPFSSTFTGKLDSAEALYDGNQGNLVGLKTFEKDTPQHTVLFGMSGAGKSYHMRDILEQTQALYDYTAIIEEGLSYEGYTRAMGETPIIVHPDGELTINYLDTRGYPLTTEQRNTAVALVSKMIGSPLDVAAEQLQKAQLSYYIDMAYRDVLEDWEKKHRERIPEIKRIACATWKWKRDKLAPQTTFLEAYATINEGIKNNNDEILTFIDEIKESEINTFIKSAETEQLYINTAFAYLKPEEFPQHHQVIELMRYATASSHDKRQIHDLATLLSAWTSTGQYGKLFDGVTNLSLKGSVVHFELGYIDENAPELKTACGLLVTGFVRQHIVTMPRHLRKRIIFEEVARFLDVPGGEQIVREAYAQLRKFSCCATSIVQQYAKFKESSIRSVIMGNSKQYWIMKQNDRSDLEDMAKDIQLSETVIDAIQQYPLPEHLSENNKFSSICYYSPVSNPALCGTMRNFDTKNILEANEIKAL